MKRPVMEVADLTWLPLDLLRKIVAEYLPIWMLQNLCLTAKHFRALGRDESLFMMIAQQYNPRLTVQNKHSYTWKDIVMTIGYYQTKFSRSVHARYGLKFRNRPEKLLDNRDTDAISFKYTGLMIDPESIGSPMRVSWKGCPYLNEVIVLAFNRPLPDFHEVDIGKLKPIYKTCLPKSSLKLIPPIDALFQSVDHHGILTRSGITLFDRHHSIVAWEINHFWRWTNAMIQECHQEMLRLYHRANSIFAQRIYYKITDVEGNNLQMIKKGGSEKEYLMIAFRASKKRNQTYVNPKIEVIGSSVKKGKELSLYFSANVNLQDLPRKERFMCSKQDNDWTPLEVNPYRNPDGTYCSKLVKNKDDRYIKVHPYDYWYADELYLSKYWQSFELNMLDGYRRSNKLPQTVLFTPVSCPEMISGK